jgi:Alkylmercury lyase
LVVRVELLLVKECPHADAARTLLAHSLKELGLDVVMIERVGGYPSPTILVDGIDVMTGANGVAEIHACRLDVPTQAAVTAALRAAASSPGSPVDSDDYPAQLAVGVTRDRLAEVSPQARLEHRAILRGFATTGAAPDAAALASASPAGSDIGSLLAELHSHDLVRIDTAGQIVAAYPFSGLPTAHVVAIEGGPVVHAMCAIDALGIGDMLGRDTTITSTDPNSGQPITVTIRNRQSDWMPDTTVVLVGSDSTAGPSDCCPPQSDQAGVVAAADRCCGVMNFFTSTESANAWLAKHPQVTGMILTQRQALRLGVDIFGRLLDDQP